MGKWTGRGFAARAFLVSLPLLEIGYPRTHVFTAALLLVTLATAAARQRRAAALLVLAWVGSWRSSRGTAIPPNPSRGR